MKRTIKKVLVGLLCITTALSACACGSSGVHSKKPSFRTPELFAGITEETGVHMKVELDDVEMEMYEKDDQIYVDYDDGSGAYVVIADKETMTVLDPGTKSGVKSLLDADSKKDIKKISGSAKNIYEAAGDSDGWKKETVKHDGMEYECETIENKKQKTQFLYNDDGDLVYVIAKKGSDKSVIKIEALDGNVPRNIFEVPSGYDIEDETDGKSDSTKKDSKKIAGKKDSGKKDSGKNARIPSPSGKYETYTISSGYQFDYDKAYEVEESDDITRVYTYKKGSVPFFYLFLMQNYSGQSAQELLSGVGNQKVKELGSKLVKGPITNTVDLGNRKIDGIEWIYTSDDGTKQYVGVQYTEVINTFFFNWCAVYEVGDTETPKGLENAMRTFKMLAT